MPFLTTHTYIHMSIALGTMFGHIDWTQGSSCVHCLFHNLLAVALALAMPRVLEPALKICFQLTKLFTLRGTEKAENRYTHRARLQHRA